MMLSNDDDNIRKRLSGLFENFVNMEAAPSKNPIFTKFIAVVNNVVSKHGMNPTWAGSQAKSTQVDGYSDADIWIETYKRNVTSQERDIICRNIILECQNTFDLNVIDETPMIKPVATGFNIGMYSIDVVFSSGEWIKDFSRVVNPNVGCTDFYKRFDRQRAVKALKLLSRDTPREFPHMQGLRLERLVLLASQDVDKNYQSHVEYASGFLLFRTCLFQFAFANSPADLIRAVAESVPAPSRGDQWVLCDDVFNEWKVNSAFVLAAIHDLRVTSTSSASISGDSLKSALSCTERTALGLTLQVDSLNRICFAK